MLFTYLLQKIYNLHKQWLGIEIFKEKQTNLRDMDLQQNIMYALPPGTSFTIFN